MEPLVSTAWLASNLEDPLLRVLECTVVLSRGPGGRGYVAESGRGGWEAGHIPGSDFIDVVSDLSDPDATVLFTKPTLEQLATSMEAVGVGEGTHVVLYDRDESEWSTRVWWLLRAAGFDDAAVLDGGWRTWTLEGRPVSVERPSVRPPARFVVRPRPAVLVSKEEVLAALDDGATCIVNALSAKQHRGEDVGYARRGHIPGALNIPARELRDPETDRYVGRDTLRARFRSLFDTPRVITYCGGGIAATTDAFLLTLLGHPNVAVYDGSMLEWADDPSLPLEVE